jgi:hypothetical protein
MNERLLCVVTTIRPPSAATTRLAELIASNPESEMIVVGDAKGPLEYDLPRTTFFSLERQLALELETTRILPVNHYSRKNVGYLIAIRKGATCIYETDDDNTPLETWEPRSCLIRAQPVQTSHRWENVYRFFSSALIWPRGFPLNQVRNTAAPECSTARLELMEAPIQQGLANGSPDVDAVWRMVLDHEVEFDRHPSIMLPRGVYCPFNSQSTWWWPTAFPLMYLPSYCSFRMTDIWRSFIAQRCLWELGYGLVFHPAEVYQQRNTHNLMSDFEDEVQGYVRNEAIVERLLGLELQDGNGNLQSNLRRCYEALVAEGCFPSDELVLLDAFLNDLSLVRPILSQ